MGTYVFQPGDRILDGYTVEKPLGHGGFGEVYHATSAAGKDVAIKLIQRFLEIELRGVGHCLNLKHAHLVTIYDVRPDSDGRQWIVMEYVAGESLSDGIQKNPDGMPVEEALRWFEPICHAVEHLHQSGIVHRDLKPGNIFDDRGTIKVGDYGLAKFITASKRSAQTQSVGTLHYMAPEVGSGRYGREVDVYAVGVILYEMLTGKVPFEGESAAEILMKHLTSPPDLEALPVAFRGVVARMLAKNPNDRYGSLGAVLADLKVKLADAAHAEAIGETSQYPAYEAALVSRAGLSDWLETPLALLGAMEGRAHSAPPAPARSAERHGGAISEALRRRPLLSAFCAFLLLLFIVGTSLSLADLEHRERTGTGSGIPAQAMTLLFCFAAAPAGHVAAFGYLLRYGSRDGSFRAAWRRRPVLTGLWAFLMFLPLVDGLAVLAELQPFEVGPGYRPSMMFFVLLAVVPSVLVAAVGFLLRTGEDRPVEERLYPASAAPPSPAPAARRMAAEFQPTVIGEVPPRYEPHESSPPGPPRSKPVVLSDLHELDRDWQAYCERYLKRTNDGRFCIPGVDEMRITIWIVAAFSALVAGGAVLLGIAGVESGVVVALLLAAGVAAITILPFLARLKIAHVYPRSLRNYRAERRRLLAELGELGAETAPFVTAESWLEPFAAASHRHRPVGAGRQIVALAVWIGLAVLCLMVAYLLGGLNTGWLMLVCVAALLIAALIVAFRRSRALGTAVVVSLALVVLVLFSWVSVGENRGVPATVLESFPPDPAVPFLQFVGYEHDGPDVLFRCTQLADWDTEIGGAPGSFQARFEEPGGRAVIDVWQIDESEIAEAQKSAVELAGSEGTYVVLRYLHQRMSDQTKHNLLGAGVIDSAEWAGDTQMRGPMGAFFTRKITATDSSDGEGIEGLRATFWDGQIGLLVVCRAKAPSVAYEQLFRQILESIHATRPADVKPAAPAATAGESS